jgi:hypothetical protein
MDCFENLMDFKDNIHQMPIISHATQKIVAKCSYRHWSVCIAAMTGFVKLAQHGK